MLDKQTIKRLRVDAGERIRLKDYDPGWKQSKALEELGEVKVKQIAKQYLAEDVAKLSKAQELLYANDRYAILVILQGLDASGKDGTIKHVMSGINPQGCQVFSFKSPSEEELDHTFLWRCVKRLPERGRIGIFNRSYFEDVLVVKSHPEILAKLKLPPGKRDKKFWQQRYDDINAFEHHLVRNGTVVLKFFLHVSHEEQQKRLLERLDRPEKNWKFSQADLDERAFWKANMQAYEDCLNETSTQGAPWYIVPADHKWVTRAIVADILTDTIESLDLSYPNVSDEQKKLIAKARRELGK